MRVLAALYIALILAVGQPIGANGAQPETFFAGKTIYLAIGYGPGGANDVWGRTIAKHLGNHIPGRPRVIVQNVPGAGGLTLMNQLYNISPKDGTFVGLINRACHSRSCSAVKACSSIRCG
jgi:tripartite-type tricarboxylate transporter receptor subunit TctC